MKKLLGTVALLAAASYLGWDQFHDQSVPAGAHARSHDLSANTLDEQRSGTQIQGVGVVIKVLPDDNKGSRHQRFIVSLSSGQTLLITHNIDLAPRVSTLRIGDSVEFNGEFEWNSKGGVVHWTHHDPDGRHAAGWLKHKGRTYQ